MNGKEKFLDSLKVGACRRCCILYCNRGGKRDEIEHKYLAGRWPRVQVAPDPTLIIWKNLGIGKIERFFRNLTIYIIALCLVVAGSVAITAIY